MDIRLSQSQPCGFLKRRRCHTSAADAKGVTSSEPPQPPPAAPPVDDEEAPLIQEVGGYVQGTHVHELPPLYCDQCPASDAEEAATDDHATLNANKACAAAVLACDSCPPRDAEAAASYDQTASHAQSPPVRTTRAWRLRQALFPNLSSTTPVLPLRSLRSRVDAYVASASSRRPPPKLTFEICIAINRYLAKTSDPNMFHRVPEGGPVTYVFLGRINARSSSRSIHRLFQYLYPGCSTHLQRICIRTERITATCRHDKPGNDTKERNHFDKANGWKWCSTAGKPGNSGP